MGRAPCFLVQRDRRNLIRALIPVLFTLPDEEDRLFDALQCLARRTVPRDWKAWNELEEEDVGILCYRAYASPKTDVLNEWSERITAAR